MNVTFKEGEVVNGWKIRGTLGLNRFIAFKDDIVLCFDTDAGEGRNYSKVKWFTDKKIRRTFQAQRYLHKYVSVAQGLSNELYNKYRRENDINVAQD